jgi:hypothetical protein
VAAVLCITHKNASCAHVLLPRRRIFATKKLNQLNQLNQKQLKKNNN